MIPNLILALEVAALWCLWSTDHHYLRWSILFLTILDLGTQRIAVISARRGDEYKVQKFWTLTNLVIAIVTGLVAAVGIVISFL